MALNPNALLSEGRRTALPSVNRGSGKSPLIKGYFWAAREVAELLVANRAPPDTVVFPALFLFRHALELTFKELLTGYRYELGKDEEFGGGGHRLPILWEQLAPLLKDSEHSLHEPAPAEYEEARLFMDDLVQVMAEIDPDGQHARYEVTSATSKAPTGPTLTRFPVVNLEVLAQLVEKTSVWAEYLLGERAEVVSLLALSRNDLGLGARREGQPRAKKQE